MERTDEAHGLNSQKTRMVSSSFEPHPPHAGTWCSRFCTATECEFDLVRKQSGHGTGLRPWIPMQLVERSHEPLNETDCSVTIKTGLRDDQA